MISPNDFLRVIKYVDDKQTFRIATVSSTSAGIALTFAGESATSTKKYPYLTSYTPVLSDKVLVAEVSNSKVILGKITT